LKPGRKKVCLLTDHHIAINPRLWKEAFFYEKRGYEVVILSMWQSGDLLEKDWEILKGHAISYKAYLNLLPGGMNKPGRLYYRLKKKLAGELQRLFKTGTASAISYAPGLMLKKALKENADLYAAHLECAFYAGKQLLKAGKKVCFDFEDWYSRDYLIPSRPVGLLKSLEKFALNNGLFCTAASKAMAGALIDTYNIKKDVTVIYNGFPIDEAVEKDRKQHYTNANEHPKLIWFSRTIGPGRGIEFLIQALALYHRPVELHVLGKMRKGFKEVLETGFKELKNHTLVIHGFMPHNRLQAFIAQFDIGLAIEENINDNKMLTVSNKMLQYLQAGIPVIASDTKGQQEVAAYFPGTVRIIDIEKPGMLGDAIDSLANKSNSYKEEQADTFNKVFSWEAQESKLTDLLEKHLCVST
jgi:glycosyltransferase involved in cell wall biosynthesis